MVSLNVVYCAVEIFALCLTALLLAVCLYERREDGKVDGFFITVLESHIGTLTFDIIFNMLEGRLSERPLMIVSFAASYFFSTVAVLMFVGYVVNYLKKYDDNIPPRIMEVAFTITIINAIIWLILSPFKLVMYFDENGMCHKGELYPLTVISSFIILTNLFFLIIKYRKKAGKQKMVILTSFFVPPILAIPTTIFMDSSVIYTMITLSLTLIFATLHFDQVVENSQKEKVIEKQKAELAKNQSIMLVSQMQPHFLYNVLNSIYYLCEKDTTLAQKTINDFADYLRMNLDSIRNDDVITFEKELKHALTYLELEKLRFDDELEYSMDIQVSDFYIPSLSLQPIVENAVKHGVSKKVGGGSVKITTRLEGEYVEIIVEDDGVGFDVNSGGVNADNSRSHIGMDSVKNRVELMSKGFIKVWSVKGAGTRVAISIPYVETVE